MIYFKCLSLQEMLKKAPHLEEKQSAMTKLGFPRPVNIAGNGNV